MKFVFEKNLRILTDIVTYCHQIGALDYDIDMKTVDGVFNFTIRCNIPDVDESCIEDLRRELDRPRHKEIEQNFWGLAGDVETDCELTLVGMMVDEAEVKYEGGLFTISVKREEYQ